MGTDLCVADFLWQLTQLPPVFTPAVSTSQRHLSCFGASTIIERERERDRERAQRLGPNRGLFFSIFCLPLFSATELQFSAPYFLRSLYVGLRISRCIIHFMVYFFKYIFFSFWPVSQFATAFIFVHFKGSSRLLLDSIVSLQQHLSLLATNLIYVQLLLTKCSIQ